MTPDKAFRIYTATRIHFSDKGSYNARKMNFNGPWDTKAKFENDTNRFLYGKMAKKYSDRDFILLCLANNLKKPRAVLADYEDSHRVDLEGKLQSLTYSLKKDLATLVGECPNYGDLFRLDVGTTPLLRMYKAGVVQLETLLAIENLTPFCDVLSTQVDPILNLWPSILRKVRQYSDYTNGWFDLDSMREIFLEHYRQ